MFRFIKYFVFEWRNYPISMSVTREFKEKYPEKFKKMEQSDLERGIKPYKNRLDFALRNTKIRMGDCRYSRKCRRYGGDCDICNSKQKGR